jgi:uncharacterized membrane protein YesL
MDNGLFVFLGKVCDAVILSALWLVFCIPIITIGPANTALYYATVKSIRRERGYIYREFFKSFRLNFKKGAIAGVLLTIVFSVLGFDLMWSWSAFNTNESGSVLFGVFIAITFIIYCFSLYVFPVLSRFDMKFAQLAKASLLMSIKHLPYTLGMAIITAAAIVAANYFLILIFILPVAATYLNSFLMERVLKKYMPKSEGPGEETGKDEWYLE